MSKQTLRKEIRQQKKAYSADELCRMSESVTKRLLAHPRLKTAHTILLYASLADEVDTHRLTDCLLQQGKTILLPVVINDHDMKICRYDHSTTVANGPFGIIEPQAEAFTHYHEIDLALIPGMAFDRAGHRLGRGKGYYDRFLSQATNIYKIGVCFAFQMVDEVPTDENDIMMNEVIY